MRRTVLLALGVWMGTLPRAWADSEFAVSLSGSATDPWANHVSAVADSGFSVYLWLTCSVGPDALLNGMEGYILTDYTLRGFEELNGSHYVEYGPRSTSAWLPTGVLGLRISWAAGCLPTRSTGRPERSVWPAGMQRRRRPSGRPTAPVRCRT